jgi:general secretion pathway protein H
MAARDTESGLTLLEVLVALGIVAMAIGLGLPLLQRGSSPLQATSAAREIAAALRESRAVAIAENRVVAFWLDTGAGRFGYGERRFALPAQGSDAPLSLILYTTEDQQTGGSARVRSGAGLIRFFPGGGSTGGGVAVSDSRRRILITVDWLSGQVGVTEAAISSPVPRGVAHAAR